MSIVALVADDHALFRQAVIFLLKRECGVNEVIEASSFDEALRCLGERKDILLAVVDLYMPGLKSASSIRLLREAFPRVYIVVLTSSTLRQDILDALEAGVHGFVRKTASPDEISSTIMQVISGKICIPAETAHYQDNLPTFPIKTEASLLHKLTPRQLEIVQHLKNGLSNKHIARELQLSENTVKVHINAVYRALGIQHRSQVANILQNYLLSSKIRQ